MSKRRVCELLDLHPSSVMRLVREGRFPQPIRTGDIGSAVRWRSGDIAAWIDARMAAATEGRAA